MKPLYVYPQEHWSAAKCALMAKRQVRDGCGTLHPWPGLIAGSASNYPEYGQTVRFNGGTIIDGELYQSVHKPLPAIPPGFRFMHRPTWGTYIAPSP